MTYVEECPTDEFAPVDGRPRVFTEDERGSAILATFALIFAALAAFFTLHGERLLGGVSLGLALLAVSIGVLALTRFPWDE